MSDATEAGSGRRASKRAAVFRTIGEVAEDLDLPAHVLRFWESKFPQLKPLKRGGGRRYYRPEDIALLARIRQCLYQEGYTIRGVQKLLSDGTLGAAAVSPEIAPSLFPLDPLPEPAPAKPPRTPRRAASAAEPRAAEPPAALSDDAKAMLEAAAQDLLSARQMLDALLHRSRKS
ncbi:MAG TPA: MerR family transcriptional regulator [Stellaceae bacterium]|nr:MerR family transcriptional regulator [Stellaceae bacterium]